MSCDEVRALKYSVGKNKCNTFSFVLFALLYLLWEIDAHKERNFARAILTTRHDKFLIEKPF